MEKISLLRCAACLKIFDQWTMVDHAIKRTCINRFYVVEPTKWNIVWWFINRPKHVIKLLIEDIREKYHAKRV